MEKTAGLSLKIPALIIIFILLYWYSAVIKIPIKTDQLPDRGNFNFGNNLEMNYLFSPGAGKEDENKTISATLSFKCLNKNIAPIEKGMINIFLALEQNVSDGLKNTISIIRDFVTDKNNKFSSNIDVNFITPNGQIRDLNYISNFTDKSISKTETTFDHATFFKKSEKALKRTNNINYKCNLVITDFKGKHAKKLSDLVINHLDVKTIFLKRAEPCDFVYDQSIDYYFSKQPKDLSKIINTIFKDMMNIGFQRVNLNIKNNGNLDIKNIYGAKTLDDGQNKILLINKVYYNKRKEIILKLRFKKPYAGLNSMFTIQAETIPAITTKHTKNSLIHHNWIKSYLFLPKDSKYKINNNSNPEKKAELFVKLEKAWQTKNSGNIETKKLIQQIIAELRIESVL